MRRTSLTAALAIVGVAAVAGQQPPAQRAEGTMKAGVSAVLVDVVVRDKKGEPVRDLKPGEVQLTEDGVPQTITAFLPMADGLPVPVGGATAAPSITPLAARSVVGAAAPVEATPTVTALLFDRLTPEARRLAVGAAQNYFGAKPEAPGYVGIFGIDLALSPYAPFTRNARVLKRALETMNQRATTTSNSQEARQRASAFEQQADAESASAASAQASAAGGGGSVGTGAGDAALATMAASMIRGFDALERDQLGYATTDGILAIVEQMRNLPGRKSLVLFSEGIALPPAVQRRFESVSDAANRANVSIYTIDAAGLRAESEQAKIRDQVNKAGAGGGGILGGGRVSDGPLSKSLEYNEDVLRQDPRNALLGLARDTGGVAFDSTNNFRPSFERIESDLRNYYLLGYTPTNDKYDGRFRTIDVKVARPGVIVSARKGYLAVPDSGGSPVSSWEAPVIGALATKPVPNAFPVRTGAWLFPDKDRPGLVPLVVSFKTAPLSYTPSADGQTYASDFAVLVRFIDDQNHVVKKVSQYYNQKWAAAEIARVKAGDVLFYREPELQPGVYTMESIVYDNPTGKASVRFTTVEVPKADLHANELRLSSLILTARAEKVPAADQRKDNPLQVGDTLVYPNLGESVSKKAKAVGFFFTAYPAASGPAPEATLSLIDNGKVVAQLQLTLPKPDASGRIQEAGRIPIDSLEPGTYEIQVVVKQGTAQLVRNTLLRLVE